MKEVTTFVTTDAGQLPSGSPGAAPHTQTVAGVWVVVWRVDRFGVPGRRGGPDPAGPAGDEPAPARGGWVRPVRARRPVPRR
ncbi:MAG: hypothetical protein ACRDTH_17510 [Pseudonocardiaceae bacterium]